MGAFRHILKTNKHELCRGGHVGDYEESRYWRKRVQELEEKIEQLRLSRRVLMNLLERLERERCNSLTHLEKENRKLHSLNLRYARSLLQKNIQIRELESKLQSDGNWELGIGNWVQEEKEEKLP
jgi:predicted RNase H-like nuclease (RuvC/YqgF family)